MFTPAASSIRAFCWHYLRGVGAETAKKAWQAAALQHLGDPFTASAQQVLYAGWGFGAPGAEDADQPTPAPD